MKSTTLFRRAEGFSLLELVVAVAITSMIIVGITTIIFHLIFHREHTQDSMIASEQLRSAHYWLSLDGLVAQNTEIGDDLETPGNEVLTLFWVGYERRDAQDNQLADLYEVRYLYDGDAIRRIKNVTTATYDSDGNLLDLCSSNLTITVARNIADINIGSDNLSLDISLTAVVNDVENAKSFNISPRGVTDL